MDQVRHGTDALFILLGAIMVLAMHSGFAFLELGDRAQKNQVNALVKILVDFAVSTIVYFFVGYTSPTASTSSAAPRRCRPRNGYELVKFFFLLTFAAAIPAIVSGGIAERARFGPQLVGDRGARRLRLPAVRGRRLEPALRHPGLDQRATGADFHDFAGSVVVHAVGGWIALAAVLLLGPRRTATARTARSARTRRAASRSWRSAPGCWRSAGSAST